MTNIGTANCILYLKHVCMNLSLGFGISLKSRIPALACKNTTPSVAIKRKLLM